MSNLGHQPVIVMILGLLSVFFLSTCSRNGYDKYQAISYVSTLKIDNPKELKAPPGMVLPTRNQYFYIPSVDINSQNDTRVDLKPPTQSLMNEQSSQAQISGNVGRLVIKGSSGFVWSQIINILQKNGFITFYRQDIHKNLFTNWVRWNSHADNEENVYSGRYQISMKENGSYQKIKVTLIDLRQKDKEVTSSSQIQNYTVRMCSYLAKELNMMIHQNQTVPVIFKNYKQNIHAYSSTSDIGLSNIILCASFDHIWSWLPEILKILNIELKESNYSHGSLKVKYTSLSRKTIHKLGVTDINFKNGYYKLQVGDLGSYSSLQFFDPTGHLVNRLQHEKILSILKLITIKNKQA
ncbi:outer membrane protein assembly factor BamC [Candidatus Erwinia haradaeae]|uniref:Outer membrane protein assembly factor BamC n=1 Tax=Candidatus Erwinia haradaeae TaxID=1922217 RepID=A0A451D2W7_9GAMM|nr:outer membrane protein assembly factor BamC [Candidatus Erwinia haradaeae]VFP80008.1 Outer membrane protein assembly factor BamC [Candidatus Erwinia haradaeae]